MDVEGEVVLDFHIAAVSSPKYYEVSKALFILAFIYLKRNDESRFFAIESD